MPKEGNPTDTSMLTRGGFVVLVVAVRQLGPGQRPSRMPSDRSAFMSGALEVRPRLVDESV